MPHWRIHLKGGPNTYCHAAVVDRHKVYSLGGYCMDPKKRDQIEVHIFNTESLRWKKLPPVECPLEVPNMRYDHTAVLIDNLIYTWGGFPYCNILYTFDVDTHRWFKPNASGTVPKERANHSACVLGEVMYIHGGYVQCTGLTDDMHKLDTATMVWSVINTRGTPPPASKHNSATIIGSKMFVFEGLGCQGSEIKMFDTETNLWLSTPSGWIIPEKRWGQSAFAYKGELYIFGGYNFNRYNDLLKFSPETFSWTTIELKGKGPCLRLYRMCCCMVGDRIVIFGGCNTLDDLYILDFIPSMKTICMVAVIQYGLDQSEIPHNIKRVLAAMNY